jgi:hypothetical protein
MTHSETIGAIAKALAMAQAEYAPVPKNKTAKVKMKAGGEFSYNYADLADCLSMALPRLSKNGIAFCQPHIMEAGKLRVVTLLIHESGEWLQSDGIEISEIGEPQQFGAESTYFRRYDGCSFIGVAPDEDTDAQQAGNRSRRTTPAQAMQNSSIPPTDYEPDLPSESGAISHQPTGAAQAPPVAQPPTSQPAAAPAVSQGQHGGVFTLLPPENNTLICTVRGVKNKETKPTSDKVKPKPYLVVTVNGFLHPECDPDNPNINGIFCYDTKLFDAVKGAVSKQCLFKLDLTGKFVKLIDVLEVDGYEFKDGQIVMEGAAQ